MFDIYLLQRTKYIWIVENDKPLQIKNRQCFQELNQAME